MTSHNSENRSTAGEYPVHFLWGDACVAAINSTPISYLQTVKEAVRHGLHLAGLTWLLRRHQAIKGFNTAEYITTDTAETFFRIYRSGGWVHGNAQESRSGIGSSIAVTAGLLQGIDAGLKIVGATSLVDVGCGDWNWMKREQFNFDYTGVDIVPEIIQHNQRYLQSGVRFSVCNATEDPVPRADAALCRDVLFHLSFHDARTVIDNIKMSTRFLIATTDFDIAFNSDIETGDFRRINLLRQPFAFPIPLGVLPDQRLMSGRYLGIWETASLTSARPNKPWPKYISNA